MAFNKLPFFSKGSKRTNEENLEISTEKINTESNDNSLLKDAEVGTDVNSISASSLTQDKTNPFIDPKTVEHYRSIYEESQYECRHLFDPEFTWTQEEEKKLVFQLEFRVALLACVMFCALQVDRGNLSQAVSDNLLNDLNLSTNEYNYGNTIFLASFLCAELPSQLVSKKIGPDRWIPMQMILWSIVAMCQAALSGKKSFYATRALLGILEGGFIPDIVLWLSYFYTSKELTVRLSWFWTTLSLTTIFTSLLAYGILHLRGVDGWAGWRWLFLIEGLFTFVIGVGSTFLMVPSAAQTKSWLFKKGWFTERQAKIVVNRVLRDDPSKGDMHNRQPITPKLLWKSLMDYDLWPVYIIGLVAYIPASTITAYLSLTIKSLGFSTFNTNLLTIPYNVIHIILLLIISWASERFNERSLVCLFQPIYTVPLLAVLRWWPGTMVNTWGTWVVTTLILGNPYIHAICVSWVSRNSNTIRTRTVSSALYNIFVQIGNIVANNIYRQDDKPLYHRGNIDLFACAVIMVPILLLTKAYYLYRNSEREAKWSVMTPEEQELYVKTTTDEGNKRLDFRFVH